MYAMLLCWWISGAMSAQALRRQRDVTWQAMDLSLRQAYGRKYFDAMHDNFARAAAKFPSDLTPVVHALVSALFSKRPVPKMAVGRGAGTVLAIFPVLPVWISDFLVRLLGAASVDLAPQSEVDSPFS